MAETPDIEQVEERLDRVIAAAEEDKERLIQRALEYLEREMRAVPAGTWARRLARAIDQGERIPITIEIVPDSALRREMEELFGPPGSDSATSEDGS